MFRTSEAEGMEVNSHGRRSKYNNELVGKQSRINCTSYFRRFILHYFNYQYAGWLRRTYFTAVREAHWERLAFLPCTIFIYERRAKMRYKTKIRSIQFNQGYHKMKGIRELSRKLKMVREIRGKSENFVKFFEKLKFIALQNLIHIYVQLWNIINFTNINSVSNINNNLHCCVKLIFQ